MIIVIVGPTGVGKTHLSLSLAKKYDAIILNADAVQVYKEFNIGSAKIKKDEMEDVPHYLIDFVSPNVNYMVFDYQKDARKILEKNKDRNIIIVGGTGLYIKALLYDYKFSIEDNNNTYDDLSNEELYKLALKKDRNIDIHINNRKRLVRFLNRKEEVHESKPIFNAIYIGLTTPRSNLYEKINKRVDEMFLEGLEEEARNLYKKYCTSQIFNSAIGYKEFIPFFKKKITLEEVKDNIKKNSRHYAKRQYTWFNNQMNINWFDTDYENFSKTVNEVENFIESQEK